MPGPAAVARRPRRSMDLSSDQALVSTPVMRDIADYFRMEHCRFLSAILSEGIA